MKTEGAVDCPSCGALIPPIDVEKRRMSDEPYSGPTLGEIARLREGLDVLERWLLWSQASAVGLPSAENPPKIKSDQIVEKK